jgi:hypothetical protein
MSTLSKFMIAGSVAAMLAGAAYAAHAPVDGWVLGLDEGYLVNSQGDTVVVKLSELNGEAMKKAKVISHGTAIFMRGGHLMMASEN